MSVPITISRDLGGGREFSLIVRLPGGRISTQVLIEAPDQREIDPAIQRHPWRLRLRRLLFPSLIPITTPWAVRGHHRVRSGWLVAPSRHVG
jgi:hypothetical protein